MNKVTIFASVLALLVIGTFSEIKAQTVSRKIKLQLLKDSDCGEGGTTVKSAKIGPSKAGYLAICDSGGGETYVYEKAGNGIKRLFVGTYGQRGYMEITKKSYKSYFEITITGFSGPYLIVLESFRWNGSKFVRYKCEECNAENPNIQDCKRC